MNQRTGFCSVAERLPDYRADPHLRELLESQFALPDGLAPDEVELLRRFLAADQHLEAFYRSHPPPQRPGEQDLREAASTAQQAYTALADKLPEGWRKFLVLQAGIAGSPDNLDDFAIQEWAYTKVKTDNPHWLGKFDDDIDRGMPMRWLTQQIGLQVEMEKQRAKAPPAGAGKAAGSGCAVAILAAVALVVMWRISA